MQAQGIRRDGVGFYLPAGFGCVLILRHNLYIKLFSVIHSNYRVTSFLRNHSDAMRTQSVCLILMQTGGVPLFHEEHSAPIYKGKAH
jgi:hypothetical protein